MIIQFSNLIFKLFLSSRGKHLVSVRQIAILLMFPYGNLSGSVKATTSVRSLLINSKRRNNDTVRGKSMLRSPQKGRRYKRDAIERISNPQ